VFSLNSYTSTYNFIFINYAKSHRSLLSHKIIIIEKFNDLYFILKQFAQCRSVNFDFREIVKKSKFSQSEFSIKITCCYLKKMQVVLRTKRYKRYKHLKIIKKCVFKYSLSPSKNSISIWSHWTEIFCVTFKKKHLIVYYNVITHNHIILFTYCIVWSQNILWYDIPMAYHTHLYYIM